MTKTYQWYYNGSAIGGATGKTHTLTSGQTDSNLIECRTEVTYGTDSVAALAKYGTSSAMGADTSGLFWYRTDVGVTHTGDGTDVTGWADQKSTFDLAQLSAQDLPTWDATEGAVKFDDTTNIQGLVSSSNGPLYTEYVTNTGEFAIFVVAKTGSTTFGQAGGPVVVENGINSASFSNAISFRLNQVAPDDILMAGRIRGASLDNFEVLYTEATGASDNTKRLYSFTATQTTATLRIDGSQQATTGATPANTPTHGLLAIGAAINSDSPTTFRGVGGFDGFMYEIYATSDLSLISSIESELMTKHGIT